MVNKKAGMLRNNIKKHAELRKENKRDYAGK
jgi:hypothetical protein